MCFMNISSDDDSSTSLGSLVQCLATLTVKTFFLISHPNLLWCNLKSFPLIPGIYMCSPLTAEKPWVSCLGSRAYLGPAQVTQDKSELYRPVRRFLLPKLCKFHPSVYDVVKNTNSSRTCVFLSLTCPSYSSVPRSIQKLVLASDL